MPKRSRPSQAAARTAGSFLTDAGGKHQGVQTPEQSGVGADIVPDAVNEHLEGELRLGVARLSSAVDVAHVVHAADPEQAAFLVEHPVEIGG